MSDYINAAAGPSGGYSMEQPPAHNLNEFQQASVLDLLSEGQSNPDVIGPLIQADPNQVSAFLAEPRQAGGYSGQSFQADPSFSSEPFMGSPYDPASSAAGLSGVEGEQPPISGYSSLAYMLRPRDFSHMQPAFQTDPSFPQAGS